MRGEELSNDSPVLGEGSTLLSADSFLMNLRGHCCLQKKKEALECALSVSMSQY